MSPTAGKGNIIPTMRYRDAPAAIDWLCNAFGFSRQLVVPGEDGTIVHAQLTLGNGMIMLGTDRDDQFGRMIKTPKEIGTTTQSAYIVIDEIDAHYQTARAAGAKIVMEIADQDHGGRLYSTKDPEGHLWNFGSYDPWAET
jgi:uncharacterized glyoxalase superfamily protein PhnB